MTCDFTTPFDRDARTAIRTRTCPCRLSRPALANLCFILIKGGGFLGSIYLAVLGLPLLLALLAVGGDLALFFAQLGNLAEHFRLADPARQAVFADTVKLALFGLATLVAIWRLPRFLADISAVLDAPQAQGEVA